MDLDAQRQAIARVGRELTGHKAFKV
jgi:hypothetical protein